MSASSSTQPLSYAQILGTGSALPTRAVTNQQLADELATQGVITSDEWIVERTGIRQRYLANPDETTTALGSQAARAALSAAGIAASEIDLIIVATSTPDQIFPSTACLIQAELGAVNAAAFDLQAVCSGFVYALSAANSFIRAGQARYVLVIGAEVFSRLLDWQDRTTCVLFGDGAGAVVLGASPEPGLLACRLRADGRQAKVLTTAGRLAKGQIEGHPFLQMDGQAVFKLAVTVLDKVARECLEIAGMEAKQIDWLIPHQANIRILQATAKKLGLDESQLVLTVAEHGNTSAASVPLALDKAVRDGRIQRGQTLMLQGVGGGFTWASTLLIY
ncbi:beta-ketoacyl-ACP synthase III [Parvibium lacunae]|uniref:Beta-ketoacyl-[acyl-carrier-protein] synthase III n=1 Tax=Parvibium lacunae TaxID=1888893 RepID=A0A368L3U3_9BURK|nr:beta-ketoacyl-ACP synthase III [Parvibium lacunae]RCS58239.1 ketoacyl-ACP synthase III [Parvibium lacunae]